MIYDIIFSASFAMWFNVLREPSEVFSFWNKYANKLKNDILKKMLMCGFCHSGYIALILILTGANIIVLPCSMLLYKILNKFIYD